jgi:hypothetical protein
VGPWALGAGAGEGTPGAGAWALCVARAGMPEVAAEEPTTTSASSKNSKLVGSNGEVYISAKGNKDSLNMT